MPFDLETKIRIDYSELDRLDSEIQARTSGASGTAKVDVAPELDKASLDPALRDLKRELEARAPGIFAPLGKALDLSPARLEVRRLTSEFQSEWRKAVTAFESGTSQDFAKALDRVRGKADEVAAAIGQTQEVKLDTTKAMSNLDALKTKWGGVLDSLLTTRALGGAALMAGGAWLATSLGSSSIQAAQSEKMMQKSTRMVFGPAAAEYEAQAKALADSTGFMTAELEAAQIAFNKMATSLGMENKPIKPLTQLATDLAANTGLPQYANNIQAVTRAITSGIEGAEDALLDFGIRMDDLYVLSLPANAAFKAMGENITAEQMAQARYNALIQQTAKIHGTASETADDYAASMRKAEQKMIGAKEAVGKVLIPIASTIADFVANVPKPLLTAGVWAGIGVGLAATVSGAVIAIAALKRAIQELGSSATAGAVETSAAAATQRTASSAANTATGKLSGGLGNMATKATIAAAAISAAIPVVSAVWGATTAALEEPKQQASVQEIYKRVGTLRNLAQKGGGWAPMSAQERAELVELYGQPAKGGLSAEQVNAAIDAAQAQAIQSLEARGYMSHETAQYFAQQLQQGIDERAFAQAMRENPSAAAAQTITVILQDHTEGGVEVTDANSYAESPY